jgi:hypothetical protein
VLRCKTIHEKDIATRQVNKITNLLTLFYSTMDFVDLINTCIMLKLFLSIESWSSLKEATNSCILSILNLIVIHVQTLGENLYCTWRAPYIHEISF